MVAEVGQDVSIRSCLKLGKILLPPIGRKISVSISSTVVHELPQIARRQKQDPLAKQVMGETVALLP